jgi:hypothetical protein
VAQRIIEILIGRLITDEAFRDAFLANPSRVLQQFCAMGHELTQTEIMAVLSMPAEFWLEAAERIDPRLQKANLQKEHVS